MLTFKKKVTQTNQNLIKLIIDFEESAGTKMGCQHQGNSCMAISDDAQAPADQQLMMLSRDGSNGL